MSQTIRISQVFLILALCAAPAQANTFNNGGGLGEANTVFLWQSLDGLLKTCLQDPSCVDGVEKKNLVEALASQMPLERNAGLPRFLAPEEYPDIFRAQDGTLRAFVTTGQVGDPVTFNLDFIYPLDAISTQRRPCTLGECAATLLPALAAHHGLSGTEPFVVALANRVAALANARSQSITLAASGLRQIKASAVNFSPSLASGSRMMLLVTDGYNLADLGENLIQAAWSSPGSGELRGKELAGTRLGPLHFDGFHDRGPFIEVKLAGEFQALTSPEGGDDPQSHPWTCRFRGALNYDYAENGPTRLTLDDESFRIEEFSCLRF